MPRPPLPLTSRIRARRVAGPRPAAAGRRGLEEHRRYPQLEHEERDSMITQSNTRSKQRIQKKERNSVAGA
jgi:hypothetical protein